MEGCQVANKTKDGKYQCFYCLKKYNKPEEADKCREGHDLVYIPISRSDANKLLNYLFIPDPKILEGVPFVKFLRRTLRKRE
jgi:hypothetical protein